MNASMIQLQESDAESKQGVISVIRELCIVRNGLERADGLMVSPVMAIVRKS